MKLDGFGAIEASLGLRNRTEQTKAGSLGEKPGVATGAQAPDSSFASAKSKSKSTSRLSNSSKETAKDFSTVLEETEKSDLRTDSDPVRDSNAAAVNSRAVAVDRETPKVRVEDKTNKTVSVVDTKDVSRDIGSADTSSLEEKISAIAESLEETAETELSMRHLSMRDFLTKMKDEFGIEPKAIVNAFANLDAEALQASPEQTAAVVLSQLDLKPEQMPKAERFYREMLNETGESALNETLTGVGAGISLKVLSEQDLAMDKLQRSILGLNDAFARRAGDVSEDLSSGFPVGIDKVIVDAESNATPSQVAVPVSQATLQSKAFANINREKVSGESLTQANVDLANAVKDASDVSGAPAEIPESTLDTKKETESASTNTTSKFASLGAALSAISQGMSENSSSNSGRQESKYSNSDQTVKPRAFDSIESALAATGFDNVGTTGGRAATPLAAGSATSAALAAAAADQSGDGVSTNAQDLVRHSQLLIKNGGGEMKMQLKPEGVGEVTLKVAVKDGQVQIQMMTETDSAKRVLENNLDDLKSSLAQHKLHVDALKIEVGNEMAKQRFEQAQQDANREQTRQLAQDFMNQFRNDREGFRQGFSDMSGFRNYQQTRRNPVPEPEKISGANETKSNSSSDRRLNLVA